MAERNAVVTGGSAGVGRAVASELARQGWNVCVIARGEERLRATRRELQTFGVNALAHSADVADSAAVFAAADQVVERWNRIDLWVNCAMATVYGFARELRPEEYARVTQVTYLGYVHGTLAALRHMRPRNAGTIVQVGSALAYRAIPLQSAYCAAKFAARGFTDSLRSELIAEGSSIRVTMVHLPAVNTPQFDWARNYTACRPQPVPPIFQPEPVAREIVGAALQAPRELWVGLPAMQAIVGNMLVPGMLDRLLATRALRGQLSSEPAPAGAADNLFAPAPGEAHAHGRFDDRARRRVLGLHATTVRMVVATTGLGVLTALIATALWLVARASAS